nr:uncharacterized protein LOC109169442 [Ipomoea batatas]
MNGGEKRRGRRRQHVPLASLRKRTHCQATLLPRSAAAMSPLPELLVAVTAVVPRRWRMGASCVVAAGSARMLSSTKGRGGRDDGPKSWRGSVGVERCWEWGKTFEPKETTTTMDALLQPHRPNPQPNPRLMKDFGRPQVGGSPSCIVLTDAARNYELKTVHYNQLPSFHGSANEDALTFIRDFYGIVQHFPLNDLTEDALRMRCFPYTLKDAAKTWFMTLTPGSLRTWPEVYNKFIGKFYSHAKTAELRRKIATFSQGEGEPFHEAWERFNMLLIQCPHHGYPLELQNQTFYDGLTQTSQSMVDNAAGGAMGEKTAEETLALYEMLGANSQQKSVEADEEEPNQSPIKEGGVAECSLTDCLE